MVTGVDIRELDDDPGALAELTTRVWRKAYGGRMWFPAWDAAYFRSQLQPADRQLQVGAYAGNRLVGCVCAIPHTLRIGATRWPMSFSSWCTVDPDHQGDGTAVRLTQALKQRHTAAGLAFSLSLVNGDPRSIAFRMWSLFARAYPRDMRFLFRTGYWAKVLEPAAMARHGLTAGERLGARCLGRLLRAASGQAQAWRPRVAGDIDASAALIKAATRDQAWAIDWSPHHLARHLGDPGSIGLVADAEEGNGQPAAVASVVRMPLEGRGIVQAGVLDVWSTQHHGLAARRRLLGGLCQRLRAEGLELLIAQRSAMTPASVFAAQGFLPLPQRDHVVLLFMTDGPDLAVPDSWSLLFR